MNKKILFLSVAAAVLMGAACVVLFQQLGSVRERDRARAAALEAEAAARAVQAANLEEARRDRTRIEKQNQELAALAHNLRASEARQASNATALAGQLRAARTNGAPAGDESGLGAMFGGKGMGEMLDKMMNDPAMREMLRSQQKAMMKQMYGPLFKELNLSPDQQKKLTDLLSDSQMKAMDNASALFKDTNDDKAQATQALVEQQKKMNEDIKALLGDEKYAQYEDYQKSAVDRMLLEQFEQQATGTDTALRSDQRQQLIQLMREERARVPSLIPDDPTKFEGDFTKVFQDEGLMEKQFQWQEDLIRRVETRARGVLTPEQLKEFIEFQEQQANMQKFGMKMAREMFGGKSPGPGPGK